MNNQPASEIRTLIDVLASQASAPTCDPQLIMATCRNLAMAANDKSKPIPDDARFPGIPDNIARMTLAGLASASVSALQVFRSKITVPQAAPKTVLGADGKPATP